MSKAKRNMVAKPIVQLIAELEVAIIAEGGKIPRPIPWQDNAVIRANDLLNYLEKLQEAKAKRAVKV